MKGDLLGGSVTRPPRRLMGPRHPVTAGDLDAKADNLLQRMRDAYRLAFDKGLVPKGTDWRAPPSAQVLAPECVYYLDHWDSWVYFFVVPEGLSLQMVYAILEGWATPREERG